MSCGFKPTLPPIGAEEPQAKAFRSTVKEQGQQQQEAYVQASLRPKKGHLIAEQEGEEQGADVRPIHVGVCEKDDCVVPQGCRVKVLPLPRDTAQRPHVSTSQGHSNHPRPSQPRAARKPLANLHAPRALACTITPGALPWIRGFATDREPLAHLHAPHCRSTPVA